MIRLLNLIFGCRHRKLSFPLTIGAYTYRRCLVCGARWRYDFVNMSIKEKLSG